MLKANLGEIFFLKYQPHLMVFIIFNVHILICKQRQDGLVVNVSVYHVQRLTAYELNGLSI